MTKTKIGVTLITLLGVFFLVLIASRGVLFLLQPQPEARGIGGAFLVLALVGTWVMVRELSFGFSTQRLATELDEEGGLPEDTLPRTPGGRVVRAAADEQFGQFREAAETSPEDWRAWYRLSLAYDASGDRKRAREAARRAISLERSSRTGR